MRSVQILHDSDDTEDVAFHHDRAADHVFLADREQLTFHIGADHTVVCDAVDRREPASLYQPRTAELQKVDRHAD